MNGFAYTSNVGIKNACNVVKSNNLSTTSIIEIQLSTVKYVLKSFITFVIASILVNSLFSKISQIILTTSTITLTSYASSIIVWSIAK